ncbi:Uncharacterised protein [Clostridium sporogenes]|nr:hypothetical protein [Clostridium sporogenes]SUY60563.1 Uncharacterised protein [Clostridium sporogenes]
MIKKFKYKGKKYLLSERDLMNNIPGIRITKYGVISIIINKKLDPVKKKLMIHRFITGRGLTKMV